MSGCHDRKMYFPLPVAETGHLYILRAHDTFYKCLFVCFPAVKLRSVCKHRLTFEKNLSCVFCQLGLVCFAHTSRSVSLKDVWFWVSLKCRKYVTMIFCKQIWASEKSVDKRGNELDGLHCGEKDMTCLQCI